MSRFRGDRAGGAAIALAVEALLALALIAGLTVRMPAPAPPDPALVTFTPPPPSMPDPLPPPAPRHAAPRAEGAAAPPNRVSRASELVAPPVPPIVPPPPLVVAPKPAEGVQSSSGAAPVAGPGTGAGGEGDGNGSGRGRHGDGPGGGGGTPLRWLSGSLRDSDYPRAALRAGASGTVGLRFVVGVNGRVTSCTVTRSSGNRDLDETTCRLIQKRFRYRPSLDAQGRPYADTVTGEHAWRLYDAPDDAEGSTER